MKGDITPADAGLVEAVLTGDAARTAEVRDAMARELAAAGLGAEVARAAADALARVHGRAREGRPLTADLQRALDGVMEVSVAPAPVLSAWVGRLRVRTFDEPRLGRVAALVAEVATALQTPEG
ncbi:MAG: hypothetical protein R3F39_21880 [Myxococcota bacterium]